MAESIYKLLQQARTVATTSDACAFGVEVAIVTNVKDPDQLGRVKICFPRLPGKPESDWARVAQPAAGAGRGFYWIPQVNDEVLVAFERGQTQLPFVLGSLWNGKDKPMKGAYADENTTCMVQTKSGHQVALYDKNGEEKIVIADKSGKRTLTFDVKGKKFLIEAKEGDVELHADKKLVLYCEDLEVKTKKTGKLDIGTTFDLKVADKAGFQAGPQLNLKAQKVEVNPSALTVASIVGAVAGAVAGAAAGAATGGVSGAAAGAVAGASAGAAAGATVPTHDLPAAGAGAGAAAGARTTPAGAAGAAAGAGPAGSGAASGAGAPGTGGSAAAGGAPAATGGAAAGAPATSGGAGGGASASGAPGAAAAKGAGGGTAAAPASSAAAQPLWIELILNDAEGNPLARQPFTLRSANGAELHGVTDASGFARVESVPEAGQWEVIVDPEPQSA
jgi:Type VI secretion system/phage-baseplate injector OB domain